MGALRLALALVLLLGCRKQQVVAPEDAGPPRETWSIPHRVAGTWTGEGGVNWEAIVVHPGMSHADLLRLARLLHQTKPKTFFDVYDDDAELPALIAAQGNDDALPKKWREAHALGTVAGTVTVSDGGLEIREIQLFEWRSFRTTKL
ncbi:MAG: hypothetical protein ACXWUG_29295 [Polyangiales bacterium]